MVDGGYGYRFVINFKTKKFYIFNSETYHHEFWMGLAAQERLPSWSDFWNRKIANDYIFTGHVDVGNNRVDTDFFLPNRNVEDLEKLLDQDWKWVDKYISSQQAKNIIIDYGGL